MAKGTHNKTHKRNQHIIRRLLQDKIYTPRINAAHERLLKRTAGHGDDSLITRKKNSFRFPNDPDAEYPQAPKPVYIDRRSMNLPVEYLKKEIYEKKKNKYRRERDENLKNELLKIEGKFNEDKNIDINDMEEIEMDEDEDELNKNENEDKNNNKLYKKEKGNGMNIDDITNPSIKRRIKKAKRGGYKHRRHSKNIMNFQ